MLPQRQRGATSTSVRFDPATDTFGDGPSIPHCVETATLLANGDVLVSGFWPATGNADAVAWAGVLDPTTGAITDAPPPNRRSPRAFATPDGGVVLIAGVPLGSANELPWAVAYSL